METMTKAYSYKRFSSIKQEEGDSIRRQTELAERYIAKHPELELDTSLSLHDLGVSAFKGDNVKTGALGLFLKAVDDGLVLPGSFLLVEHLNRLSRQQVTVALELFLSITRKGINIVTLSDGFVYSQDSIDENWTKLIIAVSMMAGAHEQSREKARVIGAAWAEKRANLATERLTKMCPEWLRPVGDVGWEIIEEKAAGVRRVYELNAEGYGKSSISKILNTEGVVALSDKGWHPNTVQKLLMTRTVIGEFQAYTGRHPNRIPSGDPAPNYYPRIVDEELWLRAQRPKKSGGGSGFKEMVNVFRGLLKCPTCQGSLTTYSSTKKSGESYRTLGCYNHQRGLCAVKEKWHYPEFQDIFLKFVREIDLNALLDNREAINDSRKQAISFQLEIGRLEKQIENVALSIADDPSPALNKLLRSLEKEREANVTGLRGAEESLASKAISSDATKLRIEDAIRNLDQADFRVKLNLLLRQLISRIDVYLAGFDLSELGLAVPKGTGNDKNHRFMIITFKGGAQRGLAHDGSTIVLNQENGSRTWSGWNVINGQQVEPTSESVKFDWSEPLKSW
jgi:DNA invertase Pin-like site-specific DNA recombinase